jgi:RecA/RadA recombinase
MVKKICENCSNEFEAKRTDARYCSAKCRKAIARAEVPQGTPLVDPLLSAQQPKGVDANQVGGVTQDAVPYDREANLAAFQKMGLQKVEWITTGIPELDEFQMIPRGRVTQIQGPFAVGKTTLALNMLKGLAHKKVFYIDTEASLNPQLLTDLELDAKNFHLYNDSAFIEDMYDQLILATKSGQYDLIILDSLAACTTRTEEAGEPGDRNIGQKALIVNKLMRILPMELKNKDTALVIINQEREVIGSYVPMKYTPGGMGPVYAASLILGLKTIPSWRFPKDAKDGQFKGHEIEVTILKSKVSQPHRKTKIKLYYLDTQATDQKIVGSPIIQDEF